MIGEWQVTAMTIIAGFVLGWTINGWRWEAKEADAIKSAVAEAEKKLNDFQAASSDFETELAKLRDNERQLTKRLANETRRDSYRCILPTDGLRLLRQARNADTATSKPDSPLPAAK